jgi:hypothetical protein
VAALAIAAVLLPRVPHEREVDLRLEDPASVVGVEVTWLAEGDAEGGRAVQGGSWHFAPGTAPRSLSTTVRLPKGRYVVEITVERPEGRGSLRRVITLDDSDRLTLPIR